MSNHTSYGDMAQQSMLNYGAIPALTTINSAALTGAPPAVSNVSSMHYVNSTVSNQWASLSPIAQSGLNVTGKATFDGDVEIKGKNLIDTLATIEKRLSILVPDPEKLEHFEALQKAYNHYKMLEAMCQLPEKDK